MVLIPVNVLAKQNIPDVTNLAPTTAINAKNNEVKGEIPSITGFATTTALTAVENKIHDIDDLVKKVYYDAERKYIKDEYFTTSDYNKFTN